jgi:hypothetical protein
LVIAGIAGVIIVAGVAGWKYHEQPQFCSNTCHLMDPYEASWRSSDLEARAHAAEGLTCLDCHQPTIKQQVEEVVSHMTNDYSEPLRERKMPIETCLSCKEHGTYQEMVAVTQPLEETWGWNPHNSHWGEMECHLCHNTHRPSANYCASCHQVPTPDGWVIPEVSD